MHYYEIAIPVNIRMLYTYKSEQQVSKGCRVLVNFNGKLLTGFIWKEVSSEKLTADIRYKTILEVIDESSLLDDDLLKIAEWISNYYFCSLGTVITSMIPTAFQLQVVQEVKPIENTLPIREAISEIESRILKLLPINDWTNIDTLRNSFGNNSFLKYIERLEDAGAIEIKRLCEIKIKPKHANYIVLLEAPEPLPSLTAKQEAAYRLIKDFGDEIPLASVSDNVSYAIIKALKSKQLIKVEPRIVKHIDSSSKPDISNKVIILTKEQQDVIKHIKISLNQKVYQPYLLYGITGSGKTEIYMNLIKDCLKSGKGALVLVPEIALTPQMEEWFYNAFGDTIAILHSRRNERERLEEWKRIKRGDKQIVIGARSAVFAPLKNIGIIIVDEEHENSYKQDKAPRYNARDIAVLRAKFNNTVIVLGSATPSLESLNNAVEGKYKLLKLLKRPHNFTRPSVTVIDLKQEPPETIISAMLTDKIKNRLHNKEQTLLLLNRRGYAGYVLCMNCGLVHRCTKCDVSLIYHSETHQLMCHYCGHSEPMMQKCQHCGSYVLVYGTPGTQQLEKQLHTLFPSARILRMDTDTTGKKDSYKNMFDKMKKGDVDILFGTQMIAKGLDFSKVTLVGVIVADNSLNVPDFRASERTFQLLTQVAGRAGRGDLPGEVVIQTFNPQHYAIESAKEQNFDIFCEHELPLRVNSMYPPYCKLARLVYSHKDNTLLLQEMKLLRTFVNKIRKEYNIPDVNPFDDSNYADTAILGPVTTPIKKINERFRYHIIIKALKVNTLLNITGCFEQFSSLNKSIKVEIDIDPLSLM